MANDDDGSMRLKFLGIAKVVVWLSLPFLLWWAFESDAILSAVLLFLTAGIVPGSDIKLAPDVILTALPYVFVAIVVLIMHRELWRLGAWLVRVIRRRPAPDLSLAEDADGPSSEPETSIAPAKAHETGATPTSQPASGIHADEVVEPSLTHRQAATRLMAAQAVSSAQTSFRFKPAVARLKAYSRKHSHRLLISSIPYLDKAAYGIGYGLGWVKYRGLIAWALTVKVARFAWKVLRVESQHVGQAVVYYSVQFWRWLAPYLWELDAWLGARLDDLLRIPYVRHARQVVRDVTYDIIRFFRR